MSTDTANPAATSNSGPTIELSINDKPTGDAPVEKKDKPDCTCAASAPPPPPKLNRKDTADSIIYSSDDEWQPRGGRNRRRFVQPIRRYSISPVRRIRPPPQTLMVNSSNDLMSYFGTYDGIVDFPFPARSVVYLTTFPFTDKDVKKWTWVMSRGVEDIFLHGPSHDDEDLYPPGARAGGVGRNRSPYYEPVRIDPDVPSVYVSRALDTKVIPEDTKEKIQYHIVIQNRNRLHGSKLMIAESRQAAGIMIYYEALCGNSIVFVGATVAQKLAKRKKWTRVETLEEAIKLEEDEGVVGVIC